MYIKGKGYLDITIGEYSNFLNLENELIQFKVTHNCGVAGTIFEIVFKIRNQAIADMFIQNNTLHISYGVSPDKAHEYDVWITEVEKHKDNQGCTKISFGAVPYIELFTDRTPWSGYGNAIHMLEDYMESKTASLIPLSFYNYNPSNTSMADKWNELFSIEEPQTWSKNQATMAQFILELWLHMDLGNDTPILSFSRHKPNTILLNTLNICKEVKDKDIYHFIPENANTESNKVIKYSGQFDTKSYKYTTGYATGYNTAVYINNLEGGKDSVFIPDKEVAMATGKKAEKRFTGYRAMDNKYQNENTHGKYKKCYYMNYYKLVDLSSIVGGLLIMGDIPEELDLINPVYVQTNDNKVDGRWIVNTIQSVFSQTVNYQTTVYVCRDNYNRIEDAEHKAELYDDQEVINLSNQQVADALQAVRNLNIVTARAIRIMDGTTRAELQGYCQKVKYDFLTMFRVNDRMVDLSARLGIMHTLIVLGNDIMNSLVDKLFPYPYNTLLHDFLLNKPSLLTLLSQLVHSVIPQQYRSLWGEILTLLAEINLIMSTIHSKNTKRVSAQIVSSGSSYSPTDDGKVLQFKEDVDGNYEFDDSSSIDINKEAEGDDMSINTETISNITDEMLGNVSELDMPIPDITLNESESLLPTEDLKEVVAQKVENYLRSKGYLDGVDSDFFVSALRGKKALDFNTIKLINSNKGNMLYARYWGTFSGELNKLGRIIDISNKVITVDHSDLLDEVFEDDTIVISGVPLASGSYTVRNIRKEILTDNKTGELYTNSYITVKEDIKSYVDTPIRTYTPLSKVSKITFGHTINKYDDNGRLVNTIENVTAIHVPGKIVKGQIEKFLAPTLPINITNLGQDGFCTVLDTKFDAEVPETIIYTRTIFSTETIRNNNMQLQIVLETPSSATLSKLSNHTFTEFYIKNSFKDIYTTVPCTKIISALRNTKVWVALPNTEGPVTFYLNNKIAEMDVISDVDLGLYNAGGAPLRYNVFMSKDTFNSNNVIMEIRKTT